MKPFKYSAWLAITFTVLLWGCQQQQQPPAADIPLESDSLIQSVKAEIEKKREAMEFRQKQLPRRVLQKIERYYPIIRKYSKRYGLDWRLIVAQILKESRFRENAVSNKGAIGLMQIMPYTAREITRELDIEYIQQDPRENIAAGIYHLYKQLKYFPEAKPAHRIKLALAAYNCGPGHIFDAQAIARYLGMDPNTWPAVRATLPRLTSKDWQLHLEVWELGVPRYGYFYGYKQTIDYVDDISRTYAYLKRIF